MMKEFNSVYNNINLSDSKINYSYVIENKEGDKVVKKLNECKMLELHNDKEYKKCYKEYRKMLEFYGNEFSDKVTPDYLCEELDGVKRCNVISKLYLIYSGKRKIKVDDLSLNFVKTYNDFSILKDRNEFWPALIRDIKNAKKYIHINVFGMEGDEWGWEIARLLAEKSREGVEVKILADKAGARMTPLAFFRKPGVYKKSKELFEYYKKNGVDYVFFSAKWDDLKGPYHFDHRKFFIIDGKIAYNTGYTLQQHMKKYMFDLAIRAEGPIVNQMEASFIINYIYNGGKFRKMPFDKFLERYLPENKRGKYLGYLALNIPWGQHRITENFYRFISGAKEKVYVVNPYFTDDRIVESLIQAKRNGAEVNVVLPKNPENILNSKNAFYHALQLFKEGVNVYLYEGPEKYGRLHAKAVLVDNYYSSIGSCNMDKMALYNNFEQNVEVYDREFGEKFERTFKWILNHSEKMEKVEPLQEVMINIGGIITEAFDPVD